jgi:hypothetical protein
MQKLRRNFLALYCVLDRIRVLGLVRELMHDSLEVIPLFLDTHCWNVYATLIIITLYKTNKCTTTP